MLDIDGKSAAGICGRLDLDFMLIYSEEIAGVRILIINFIILSAASASLKQVPFLAEIDGGYNDRRCELTSGRH
jgi:hypothetical protein